MARLSNTTKGKTTGSSSLDLKAGQKLGKYRLAKYLGEGGNCEVWKARDTVESIWVALKIPLADVNGKRDNQALLREIRPLQLTTNATQIGDSTASAVALN